MKNYIIYEHLGKILRTGSAPEEYILMQALENEFVLEGVADDASQYIKGGMVLNMPSMPTRHHIFNHLAERWEDPRTPLAIKSAQWEKIKIMRDQRKTSGTQVGTLWFHSDADSRTQQLGLVMFGANLPANLQWKTMSGQFVTMTPTLAQQIFGATAQSDQAIFAKAEQHKAAMEASLDPETYDFTTGWPVIFGETA